MSTFSNTYVELAATWFAPPTQIETVERPEAAPVATGRGEAAEDAASN